MRFTVNKEQRDFFQKNGWIEFSDLFKEDQIKAIQRPLEETLAERLRIPLALVGKQPAGRLFQQGRDLWRSNAILQQFVMQPRFGDIVVELIGKKVLRLGYDQFFPALDSSSLLSRSPAYAPFMEKGLSLEEISSIKGILCGVVIALGEKREGDLHQEERTPSETIPIFPSQPGHILFFLPHLPIAWDQLANCWGQHFYLIVYTSALSSYQLQPNDPHTHSFKHLGYIFNDSLSDKLNPIVYRP